MKRYAWILFHYFFPLVVFGQSPQINEIISIQDTIGQYKKYEVSIELEATYNNPYDYDQVTLQAFISGPGSMIDTVDGFYTESRIINTTTGANTITGPPTFKIRYAPREQGDYQLRAIVKDSLGTDTSEVHSFVCFQPEDNVRLGYVRTGSGNYLRFDNGVPYIPIGENMAWQQQNPYLDYKDWLTHLKANFGNFIRLWHAHWGLGIEWKTGWNNHLGLKQYNQVTCAYQDWLFDYCDERDIYVMLTLQHHGQVSTQVNPNWKDNPYNVINGGPCANTWDFFIDSTAIALTKNRFRYILARWGYSRSIMCWELFNEVEWTDLYDVYEEDIIDWHLNMAEYLSAHDVNQHLISTSFAQDVGGERLWQSDLMDFTQIHHYDNRKDIHQPLMKGIRKMLSQYDKPTMVGEFGLGGSSNLANADPDGIHIHNAMWASMMGGAIGTAMSWWWESYIHPQDLYYHFNGLGTIAHTIELANRQMVPGVMDFRGAVDDLILKPLVNWGLTTDTLIQISEGGKIWPADAELSLFLYGSVYNTQFRSPPVFEVNYEDEGTFIVTTGSQLSTAARVVISLDDQVLIDSMARANYEYEITVPAGPHTIKVDNTGIDWVSVDSYFFSKQGTLMDGVVVLSEDQNSGAGWVLNKKYNHEEVHSAVIPDPILDGQILVKNVRNFPYQVTWYESLAGQKVGEEMIVARNGKLTIPVHELYWDRIFTFDIDRSVSTFEQVLPQFELYPNPVSRGQFIHIESQDFGPVKQGRIFNAEGRLVDQFYNQKKVILSHDLPPGLYWIHISDDHLSGIQPFVVTDR